MVFDLEEEDFGFEEDFGRDEDFREALRDGDFLDDLIEDDFGLEDDRDFTLLEDEL